MLWRGPRRGPRQGPCQKTLTTDFTVSNRSKDAAKASETEKGFGKSFGTGLVKTKWETNRCCQTGQKQWQGPAQRLCQNRNAHENDAVKPETGEARAWAKALSKQNYHGNKDVKPEKDAARALARAFITKQSRPNICCKAGKGSGTGLGRSPDKTK